jgi:transcriptional regulator GlxA family with amidase domain
MAKLTRREPVVCGAGVRLEGAAWPTASRTRGEQPAFANHSARRAPTGSAGTRLSTGIVLFDGVELMDYAGPYDIFRVTRPAGLSPGNAPPVFNIFTVAEHEIVHLDGGQRVLGDYRLDDHPPIELLVVPGGPGVRQEAALTSLIPWLRRTADAASLVASIRTGARLMARTGLWDGVRVTTHQNSRDYLRQTYPKIEVVDGVGYVDSGKFLSSAGVTAGIDLALHLVERVHGREAAAQTARIMEYEYWQGDLDSLVGY